MSYRDRAKSNAHACALAYFVLGGYLVSMAIASWAGIRNVFRLHLFLTAIVWGICYFIRLSQLANRLRNESRNSNVGGVSSGGARPRPSSSTGTLTSSREVNWSDQFTNGQQGPASSRSIEWEEEVAPSLPSSSFQNELSLIGNHDPVDGTPLLQGEHILLCTICGTGYHHDSWQFLISENNSACVSCQTRGQVREISLQVNSQAATEQDEETAQCPNCKVRNRIRGGPRSRAICGQCGLRLYPEMRDTSSPPLVTLTNVHNHIGSIVLFEGLVQDSYITKSNTCFVKFQKGHARDVFKLVIFKQYVGRFSELGIDITQYKGQHLRVMGLVQRDSRWGLEIIIRHPGMIRSI